LGLGKDSDKRLFVIGREHPVHKVFHVTHSRLDTSPCRR
jgi:hypothetical protein